MTERIIFLDTETTGCITSLDRIVEIAAVELDENYQPVSVFHEYVNPLRHVGESYFIHGLHDDFLQERQSFKEIANDFVEFVKGATVYAHNLPFDRRFIDKELRLAGLPQLSELCDAYDTLPWARGKVYGSAKLDALIEHCGLDGSARAAHHGALIDAELLAQVFLCLGRKEEIGRNLDFSEVNASDLEYQMSLRSSDNPLAPWNDVDDDSEDDHQDSEDQEDWEEDWDGDPEDKDEDEDEDDDDDEDDGDDWEAKLEAICAFADSHYDVFENGAMFEDILYQYRDTGYLSSRQMDAIDNTIDGWNIYY